MTAKIRVSRRWHPNDQPGDYPRWPWEWQHHGCDETTLLSRIATTEEAARRDGLAHLNTHKDTTP